MKAEKSLWNVWADKTLIGKAFTVDSHSAIDAVVAKAREDRVELPPAPYAAHDLYKVWPPYEERVAHPGTGDPVVID